MRPFRAFCNARLMFIFLCHFFFIRERLYLRLIGGYHFALDESANVLSSAHFLCPVIGKKLSPIHSRAFNFRGHRDGFLSFVNAFPMNWVNLYEFLT